MTSNRNRLQLPPLSRREALRLGLAGLAAGGVAGFPTTSVLAQQNLQWGSSSIGSTGYVIMEGLAKTVNRPSALQNASMANSGGHENLQPFNEGALQLGPDTPTARKPAQDGASHQP